MLVTWAQAMRTGCWRLRGTDGAAAASTGAFAADHPPNGVGMTIEDTSVSA
jgi:hypothetical protein